MPAIGVDGENIMKLIPVQMLNGQFVQTQISKPGMAFPLQKAGTIKISSAPVHMIKKAASNPAATQKCTLNKCSFLNVLPNKVGLDFGKSLNKNVPQQQTPNLLAKVPVIQKPENFGKLARLTYQPPVTVNFPTFPTGQHHEIIDLKKQVFTSSSSSSPGPRLPSVVYMTPVTAVNQRITPPCNSGVSGLKLLSKTSDKTSCEQTAKGSKSLLKLVPTFSQRPNSPIKWVIEEEEQEEKSTASNLNSLDLTSVTSEILRTVAERESMTMRCDSIRKSSEPGQGRSGQGQDNALVMCNGKVFYVAKKSSLSLKMGKSNSPTSATESDKFNKMTVPSNLPSLELNGAQALQELRNVNPDDVIDLCDEDHHEDSSKPAMSVNMSAFAHPDDDSVIFVSYIPPTSDVGLTHGQREMEETGTIGLGGVTKKRSLHGGCSNNDRDERSTFRERQTDQRDSVSTVENVQHLCPSAEVTAQDNKDLNTISCQSTFTQQVERMEPDVETQGPSYLSSLRDSNGGARSRKQESHKMQSISNPTTGRISPLTPKPCQMASPQLRQIFGITADVKICLQKIDEALAGSLHADTLKSESISSELELQKFSGSTKSWSDCNSVKGAFFNLEAKPISAMESKYLSNQSSFKGVLCENASVTWYVEPIDEDFPSTTNKNIPRSKVTPTQLRSQACMDLNPNTRRIGRARKRTICSCCIPRALDPPSKLLYKVR
ncbi:ligand-dependent nuclear receptor-interacting factor 1 isoform X2 [Echeneis naucrates]|nr:ligand-dependent nuclear receptor-interacting factor 1 isoform X2 [Echeneis naucrates]